MGRSTCGNESVNVIPKIVFTMVWAMGRCMYRLIVYLFLITRTPQLQLPAISNHVHNKRYSSWEIRFLYNHFCCPKYILCLVFLYSGTFLKRPASSRFGCRGGCSGLFDHSRGWYLRRTLKLRWLEGRCELASPWPGTLNSYCFHRWGDPGRWAAFRSERAWGDTRRRLLY